MTDRQSLGSPISVFHRYPRHENLVTRHYRKLLDLHWPRRLGNGRRFSVGFEANRVCPIRAQAPWLPDISSDDHRNLEASVCHYALRPSLSTPERMGVCWRVLQLYGAFESHLFAGDSLSKSIGPLIFSCITLLSWVLRPEERRVPMAKPPGTLPTKAWLIPIGVIAAFVAIAFFTLPK
jgi:hypothetical protein